MDDALSQYRTASKGDLSNGHLINIYTLISHNFNVAIVTHAGYIDQHTDFV